STACSHASCCKHPTRSASRRPERPGRWTGAPPRNWLPVCRGGKAIVVHFAHAALTMAIGQFAYANNSNRFLACGALADQPFAVCGIPFDGVVTNRPGARFGPQAIRAASLMLCDGIHPLFDVSPLEHLGDALDMRLPNASPLALVREHIQRQASALM